MLRVPAGSVEHELGMRCFATDTPGLGGKLRTRPDDFVVQELIRGPPPAEGGKVTVARVRLTNWENNHFLREASRRLALPRASIGFAGTKDKRAVTTQLFSFKAPVPRVLERLGGIGGVELLEAYAASKGIALGDHDGNAFRVTIRCIEHDVEETQALVERCLGQLETLGGFPNYFGVQRFGVLRPVSHRVGKLLLRGQLKDAILEYVANPFEGEEEDAFAARQTLASSGDYKQAFQNYPKKLVLEKAVLNHLAGYPDDHEGALRQLPKNLLLLFMHAYQSWLFNRVLSARLEAGLPLGDVVVGDLAAPVEPVVETETANAFPVTDANVEKVRRLVAKRRAAATGPLMGHRITFADGPMGKFERAVLAEEEVTPRDFLLDRMPELSSKGLRRILVAPVRNMSFDVAKDEMTPGSSKVTLSFTLSRGCYATCLARELMKADDATAY